MCLQKRRFRNNNFAMDNKLVPVYCNSLNMGFMRPLRFKTKLSRPELRAFAPFEPRAIVERLNRKTKSPGAIRVIRFLRLFQETKEAGKAFSRMFSRLNLNQFGTPGLRYDQVHIARLEEVPRKQRVDTGWIVSPSKLPELYQINKRLNRCLTGLNRAVARYKWHPLILSTGGESFGVLDRWNYRTVDEFFENYCIWLVCKDNLLLAPYFRHCAECNDWFFAQVQHQMFCKEACRKKHASQSEKFKEIRREYMRNYRRSEKAKNDRKMQLANR